MIHSQPVIRLDSVEIKQVLFASRDRTPLSRFLIYKKWTILDRKRPTILNGYGGFAINMVPDFVPSITAWVEMGGVYAIPNLRGGGEYGEPWHKAGMGKNKQNTFNDLYAAVDYLFANKYTSRERLAVYGESNGGLLVGAAIAQAGLFDMLRFPYLGGFSKYWEGEYGSPTRANDRAVLQAYSPLHNIKQDAQIPPTLIIAGMRDELAPAAHSFKFAAALQANASVQKSKTPIVLQIEEKQLMNVVLLRTKKLRERP